MSASLIGRFRKVGDVVAGVFECDEPPAAGQGDRIVKAPFPGYQTPPRPPVTVSLRRMLFRLPNNPAAKVS
jgi:hypothetical protein